MMEISCSIQKKHKKTIGDFRVNSTQDLIVSVNAPENSGNLTDIPASGCVSIILGFKE